MKDKEQKPKKKEQKPVRQEKELTDEKIRQDMNASLEKLLKRIKSEEMHEMTPDEYERAKRMSGDLE